MTTATYELDIPWKLIEPDDPMGADMVDIGGVKRKWLNVPYADASPSQVLDIYLPEEGDGPFPTYVFLHGGAFLAGDEQDLQFMLAIDGVNRGYAVVSVEYRKAFESKAPNALYDVKAAIRFLRAHAEEYRLDPGRFALGGDSAGAYYAVFAAATAGVPAFDGPNPVLPDVCGRVQAVVAQCGCYDLLTMTPEEDEVQEGAAAGLIPPDLTAIFIGANPRKFPDAAALLDPVTYVTKEFPPTLVQVGREDTVVPCTESQRLAAVLEQRCGAERVRFQIFDGWNHCALNHIVTPDWFMKANMDRVFGFLDETLK